MMFASATHPYVQRHKPVYKTGVYRIPTALILLSTSWALTYIQPCLAANALAGGGDPYCGVMAVYSLLTLDNKEIPLDELLTPEYVGSARGSS